MPKVMELLTFQHPIKNPVDLNLRGFCMEAEAGIEPAWADLQAGTEVLNNRSL